MPKFLVMLTDGFDEIEATSIVTVLRRAGLEVVTAGTTGNIVIGSKGMRMHADSRLIDTDVNAYHGIILPGGPGTDNLMKNQTIIRTLQDFNRQGKFIGTIGMASLVLAKNGLLKDRKATVYPGYERHLDKPRDNAVVVDANIMTSQGPGTAIAFALKIVEQFQGKAKAEKIKQELVA